MKERRDALKERVAGLEVLIKTGKVAPIQLIEARDALLTSELELAKTENDRITLLELRVANFKQGEEYFIALKSRAEANETDVLQAKTQRLLAEIDLERAIESRQP